MTEAAVGLFLENVKQLLLHHDNLIKDVKDLLEELEEDLRNFKDFLRESANKRRNYVKLRELVEQKQSVVSEAEDVTDAIVTQAAEVKSKSYFRRVYDRAALTLKVKNLRGKIKDIYGDKTRADFAFNDDQGEPYNT